MDIQGFKMDMFSALPDYYLEKDSVTTTMTDSAARLDWLRSQVIGQNVEFGTPFGKRLLVYADHTASGRSLQFIEDFIKQMVLPVYGNTHTDDSFVGSMTGNIVHEARKYVKACLGGTDDDALLFCGSGSTAAIKKLQEVTGIGVANTMLREELLAGLKNEHRWVVFVGPYEHHSNLLSWRRSLADVVEIPLSKKGLVNITALKAALENPLYKDRPKLGSFSAGSNVTGILSGTRKIARLLHSHGAFACFDFAACAPYVKIDMRSGHEDGYDAIFVSPHKFMGGPGTSGLLLMSKDLYLLNGSPPSTCGGGTVDFVNFDEEKTIYYDDIEHREDAGTPPIVQNIRTAMVFCVKEFLTSELIASREAFFVEQAFSRLGSNPGIEVYGPTNVKRVAIFSFGIRPRLNRLERLDSFASDDEDFSANSYTSNFDGNRTPEHPQLQWRPRISQVENSPEHPIQSKKASNGFATQFTPSVSPSGARSPLRLPYVEAKSPMREESAVRSQKAEYGKPFSGRFIVKLLNDLFGIQARGGCSCAGTYGHSLLGVDVEQSLAFRQAIQKGYGAVKPGWARVSFGYYISHDEFDFILSAIEFISEYGARFLPLYDLNWRTGDWSLKPMNHEVRDAIADAEKETFGDPKQLTWSKRSNVSGPALFVGSNSFEMSSLITEEQKMTKMAHYLKMAKSVAENLPQGGAAREIPSDIDPAIVTFMI